MIEREEVITEHRAISYKSLDADGCPLFAELTETSVTVRHESVAGYVTFTFPRSAVSAVEALLAAVLADIRSA
ncbi:hypothetical protein [Glaciibacter psychrotolerans]|uniref:Uncharacterized protein n=1 Tax=Glaciibacter psychrotolerans TaxID=670054 RepID=A0A7Z0J5U4_9MICO|nr:hypothetical protein [Leifsonia psychrotolerans]NYJ19208.1 hypothetical protein [Leifsonia psychrotolerans]